MWNFKPTETPSISPIPEQPCSEPVAPAFKPITLSTARPIDQSTIGQGVIIRGEITGSESLFIDGFAEGSINLPENHLTIGRNANITANITALDIVVMGKVYGNVTALNRLEIRDNSTVTGDVIAARLKLEEGASFKGSINIMKAEAKPETKLEGATRVVATSKTYLVVQPETGKLTRQPVAVSA